MSNVTNSPDYGKQMLTGDCPVSIAVSNNSGANRISVNTTIPFKTLGIPTPSELGGVEVPTKSLSELVQEIESDASLSKDEKITKCAAVFNEYKSNSVQNLMSPKNWDSIFVGAVLNYLVEHHGLTQSDTGPDSKVIKADDLVVNINFTGQTSILVVGQANWG